MGAQLQGEIFYRDEDSKTGRRTYGVRDLEDRTTAFVTTWPRLRDVPMENPLHSPAWEELVTGSVVRVTFGIYSSKNEKGQRFTNMPLAGYKVLAKPDDKS